MELLSPAGSFGAMIAAVQSGADAVYMGGNKFSARHSAGFSKADMIKAIEYCHIRGVDVHVAANILVKEKEANEFIEYVGELNEIGVDAVIIQDIGMAQKVRRFFPDLPLHGSTQMTCASYDGVKLLADMGFSRVVLSRELSLSEIESICQKSSVEIEVFVHGAICMCYSGQCLMSSVIGGRSGNRGMCAQPCRLPYEIEKNGKIYEKGYLLSPKDMALADELSALEKAGVTSLKIEGRLKRPEYTAQVTGVYKRLLSEGKKATDRDFEELENAFNRSGFTKGYFISEKGRKMMSIQTPGNVSDNNFTDGVRQRCREDANERKIKIDIYGVLRENECFQITITDEDYNSVTIEGEVPSQKALNKPLDTQRVKAQLAKLGSTPFYAENIDVLQDDGIVVPVSEINSVRRKAIEALSKKRCEVKKRRSYDIVWDKPCEEKKTEPVFSASVKTMEQAEAVLGFDVPLIYAPPILAEKIKELSPSKKVVTILPPVFKDKDRKEVYVADGVLVSNIGQLEYYKDYPCYGGQRLNIYNKSSVEFYKNLKVAALSPELNLGEMKEIFPYTPLEAMVYGRISLMVMENCPAKMYTGCTEGAALTDRRGEKFPLSCTVGCYSELLNSKPLYMADKSDDLKKLPLSYWRLDFTTETKKETISVLDGYFHNRGNKPKDNSFTRGHYYRGVE